MDTDKARRALEEAEARDALLELINDKLNETRKYPQPYPPLDPELRLRQLHRILGLRAPMTGDDWVTVLLVILTAAIVVVLVCVILGGAIAG